MASYAVSNTYVAYSFPIFPHTHWEWPLWVQLDKQVARQDLDWKGNTAVYKVMDSCGARGEFLVPLVLKL